MFLWSKHAGPMGGEDEEIERQTEFDVQQK